MSLLSCRGAHSTHENNAVYYESEDRSSTHKRLVKIVLFIQLIWPWTYTSTRAAGVLYLLSRINPRRVVNLCTLEKVWPDHAISSNNYYHKFTEGYNKNYFLWTFWLSHSTCSFIAGSVWNTLYKNWVFHVSLWVQGGQI